MRRDVTTVRRWEKREGAARPRARPRQDRIGLRFPDRSRRLGAQFSSLALGAENVQEVPAPGPSSSSRWRCQERRAETSGPLDFDCIRSSSGRRCSFILFLQPWESSSQNPLANARFLQLTDFSGIEQAATLSRDGKFVAFLSDRDGRMDVWVTQVGTGQFYNLGVGGTGELVNPSLRTLGFSPDGTLVTFWARGSTSIDESAPTSAFGRHQFSADRRRPYLDGSSRIRFVRRRRPSRLPHARTWRSHVRERFPARRRQRAKSSTSPPGLHSHFLAVVSGSSNSSISSRVQCPTAWISGASCPTGGSLPPVTNHDSTVKSSCFSGRANADVPRDRIGRVQAHGCSASTSRTPHPTPCKQRNRQIHVACREFRRPASGGNTGKSEGHALAIAHERCWRRDVWRPGGSR